jgi:transcriptional regulator with XRE-family HTH domain
MLKQEIGQRFQQLRKHLGYSQDKMAALIGIRKVTYGKNERGLHLPDTFTLIALYNGLGVSVDWLLFNRGSMFCKDQQEKPEQKEKAKKKVSDDLFTREVEEMVDLMKRVPLLHHSVMMHYQQFKIDHKEFIKEALEK